MVIPLLQTRKREVILKGYREGKGDIRRFYENWEIYERDFLCFNWITGDVCIANPHAKGIYCGLDNSREYRVMPIREINGTKYGEIHVRNHKILPDDKFLSISRDVLIQLMRENIGEGASAKNQIQSFNCVPEGVEGELSGKTRPPEYCFSTNCRPIPS